MKLELGRLAGAEQRPIEAWQQCCVDFVSLGLGHNFLPVTRFVEHLQVRNKQHQDSLSAFKRRCLWVLGIMYEWKEYARVKLLEEVSLCSSLIDLHSLCRKGWKVLRRQTVWCWSNVAAGWKSRFEVRFEHTEHRFQFPRLNTTVWGIQDAGLLELLCTQKFSTAQESVVPAPHMGCKRWGHRTLISTEGHQGHHGSSSFAVQRSNC